MLNPGRYPSDKALEAAQRDFRVFLYLIWKFLGLPDPTTMQYEVGHYLQHGPARKIILAFRGFGKSWITSAFVIWLEWKDIENKVLVVSAAKNRADAFSIFTKRLITEVPWLLHLAPDTRIKGTRDSNISFDIKGCSPAHSPSVLSSGILGNITGMRGNHIVGDDMESPNNSESATQREKLIERVAELGGSILTPIRDGAPEGIVGGCTYLGTFQVEESLYITLEDKGYELRIWPAEVPEDASVYKGRLAPSIQEMADAGVAPGTPTDPGRFDRTQLAARLVEYGPAQYALQFMLDTSQAAANIHPLKLRDFIVYDVDSTVGPDYITWAGTDEYTMDHLSRVGLDGDRFQGPMKVAEEYSPWEMKLMYVDPSGRGRDQTAVCVVYVLHGTVFIKKWAAFEGGYDPVTLTKIAALAKEFAVREVKVEDNFGDGMWTQLFAPVLRKVYVTPDGAGCSLTEEKVTGQKEIRAIETLEPPLAAHRLVIDESVVREVTARKDASLDKDAVFKSGFYQMTRLTREKGCLKWDDWLDAFAGAVRATISTVGRDAGLAAQTAKQERFEIELQKFMENAGGKMYQPAAWHEKV